LDLLETINLKLWLRIFLSPLGGIHLQEIPLLLNDLDTAREHLWKRYFHGWKIHEWPSWS